MRAAELYDFVQAVKKTAQTQNPGVAAEVKAEAKPEAGASAPAGDAVALQPDAKQTRFLSPGMAKALNDQIGFEMYSAYLYYVIAAWSQSRGLTGFQAHFEKQGDGEIQHAMKIYKYVVDTGTAVALPAIPAPPNQDLKDMRTACVLVRDHEMVVTRRWQRIGELAKSEPNLATQELAQWFMTEQVEEEDLAVTLLNKVELADSGAGLLIIDASLKAG